MENRITEASRQPKDKNYNLITALYQASENAETFKSYVEDAEQEDDQELVEFFDGILKNNLEAAQRAKEMLVPRSPRSSSGTKPFYPAGVLKSGPWLLFTEYSRKLTTFLPVLLFEDQNDFNSIMASPYVPPAFSDVTRRRFLLGSRLTVPRRLRGTAARH